MRMHEKQKNKPFSNMSSWEAANQTHLKNYNGLILNNLNKYDIFVVVLIAQISIMCS